MNDGNGRPLYLRVNYTAEGSPYLDEEYRLANVLTSENKWYLEVMIKINLLDNQVQFLDEKGMEMILTVPVRKIYFSEFIREGQSQKIVLEAFPAQFNRGNDSIFQVLDSGHVSLLRYTAISFRDEKKYGEAGITRIFKRVETFHILSGQNRSRLTIRRDALLEIMEDRKSQVAEDLGKNKLNLRSTDDLIRLFKFYNSLF